MSIYHQYSRLLVAVVFLGSAAPLPASDGQLEINRACAVNTGCFTGDSAGYQVTITQPGSYRLTGDLDLSALSPDLQAVEVGAPAVTLDLGGFQIIGPTTCTGTGISISPARLLVPATAEVVPDF